jgi:Deoxyribonuclease NucA/NucB
MKYIAAIPLSLTAFGFICLSSVAAVTDVLEFNASTVPCISENVTAGLAKDKTWKILHREMDQSSIDKNRTFACANFKGTDSCDEFPFASTTESTALRIAGNRKHTIRNAPLTQQRSQGGTMSTFYQSKKIVQGDAFTISVVGAGVCQIPQQNP